MSIQEQIEALTQEIRPYPKGIFYSFDGVSIKETSFTGTTFDKQEFKYSIFYDANKAEVEEYADCYRRLKLYQLLGKKAEKKHPVKWLLVESIEAAMENDCLYYGTDFVREPHEVCNGVIELYRKETVFGGVIFAREEDRLEALKICGIDRAFQEKCAKYGLGGA